MPNHEETKSKQAMLARGEAAGVGTQSL